MKIEDKITGVFDFVKLGFMDDGKSVLVLGYRTELTDKEYDLTKILFEAKRAMHKNELAKTCDIAISAVAVHVANINKKVLPISGRKLIEGNRRGEYKISENI